MKKNKLKISPKFKLKKEYFSKFISYIKLSIISIFTLIYFFIFHHIYVTVTRLFTKRNVFQYTLIKNFISSGIPSIFLLVFFIRYFYLLLLPIFSFNAVPINNSIFFLPNQLFSGPLQVYSIMLLVVVILFGLLNIFFILLSSQNLAMSFFSEKFVNKDNSNLTIYKKFLIILIYGLLISTFVIWPVFILIWSIIFVYNIYNSTNIIYVLLKLKILNTNNKNSKNNN